MLVPLWFYFVFGVRGRERGEWGVGHGDIWRWGMFGDALVIGMLMLHKLIKIKLDILLYFM